MVRREDARLRNRIPPWEPGITFEQLEAERQREIDEDDDVFEHGDHILRRPANAPDPHCFGFAGEQATVPVGPPEAPSVDYLFAAREAEEANRTCYAAGCFSLAEPDSLYCSLCYERDQLCPICKDPFQANGDCCRAHPELWCSSCGTMLDCGMCRECGNHRPRRVS